MTQIPERIQLASILARLDQMQEEIDTLRFWREQAASPTVEQHPIFDRVYLTAQQRAVLAFLLAHVGKVVRRESLFASGSSYFRDMDGPDEKALDSVICKIRAELHRLGEDAPTIETVWGVGYRARLATTTDKE